MENRYEQYKDSGIAWIGEIPEHWEVKKGKNLFKKEERPVRENDEIITCFRDGEVTLRSNRRTDGFTNAMKEVGYQGVRKGDLVIHNMDAFAGAIGVSDSDGKSTPVYSVCTPKYNTDANVYYYAYLLRSYALGGVIQSLAKGIRERSTDFRYKEFGDLFYQQPPIKEQQSIATYLDQKCSEIDELITLQEEMITKLQSYKQSVITEAVTKGLDKNVPLKDSGIEWIGEIPEHWTLKRIKNICDNLDYLREPISAEHRSRKNPIYDYYGASGVIDKIDYYNVDDEVLLIGEDGANLVMRNLPLVYKAKGKFWVNNHAHILKPKNDNYDFCAYAFEAADYSLFITGSAQPKLSQENLGRIKIAIPPLSEQQSIADYLDQKCSEIDELISIKQQKIEKLKDYKKSLIFECVTGKRKVS